MFVRPNSVIEVSESKTQAPSFVRGKREGETESGRAAKARGGEVSCTRTVAGPRDGGTVLRATTAPTNVSISLLFRVLEKPLTEGRCAMPHILPACLLMFLTYPQTPGKASAPKHS